MQDQSDRLCLVAHSPRNHRHNNGYLNRQSQKNISKWHIKYWIENIEKTFIFRAPSSPTTPVPHLSWLIWETMVFTAHLSLNDMGFGLGNLRPMNLSCNLISNTCSFSYTNINWDCNCCDELYQHQQMIRSSTISWALFLYISRGIFLVLFL